MVGGGQKETFNVHENLIRTSPFFDKAMSGPWQESMQRTIELPEDDPEIFAVYVHWLYDGTLPVSGVDESTTKNTEYMILLKAYCLGDKLLNTGFQHTILSAIVEKAEFPDCYVETTLPTVADITYAYENTNEHSVFRKKLVKIYASAACGNCFRGQTTYPVPFVLEVVARLLDRRGPSTTNATHYHYVEEW